ncbi:hypothetical protein B7731_08025 [Streptococcus oralis subsp. tigurinus]|uniref:Uncharacterized protein n=1 Tax=Streptococcus oralis subsp. tigurinus TaxID=1077464 RepID=A0AAX0N4Z9_STROR|nr:hypothetical protein [Streptococcus oralis]MBW8204073.1 hypothetical protein [Streptococcus oralis]ORO32994.1 hypothetical protein B7731_08025 [Streptococcus oralis subsp. tigurinus]
MSQLREKSFVTLKEDITSSFPFDKDLPMIFLGEIANMAVHGIFIGKSGEVLFWISYFTF